MIGEKKFRLTVVEETGDKDKWGNRVLRCACDCGNEVRIGFHFFNSGKKKSCGCLPCRVPNPNALRRHELYRTWVSMRSRCQNPKQTGYHNYGGRGISVCDKWNKSFIDFITDMGQRPSKDHQIDRIDNDGNYEPGNCKWATRSEQAYNRRK